MAYIENGIQYNRLINCIFSFLNYPFYKRSTNEYPVSHVLPICLYQSGISWTWIWAIRENIGLYRWRYKCDIDLDTSSKSANISTYGG